jgi:hypothetical protein
LIICSTENRFLDIRFSPSQKDPDAEISNSAAGSGERGQITSGQPRAGDSHVYAPRSRFIPNTMLGSFTRVTGDSDSEGSAGTTSASEPAAIDIATEMRQMWS